VWGKCEKVAVWNGARSIEGWMTVKLMWWKKLGLNGEKKNMKRKICETTNVCEETWKEKTGNEELKNHGLMVAQYNVYLSEKDNVLMGEEMKREMKENWRESRREENVMSIAMRKWK